MAKARGDMLTLSIFDWEPPDVSIRYAEEIGGKGSLDNRIARELSQAMRDARDAGISRAEIAVGVSERLGRSVSEDTLNKWSSEGSEGHRVPLDAFVAIIAVTGRHELVGFVARQFDLIVVDRRFEGLIELQLIEEHERDVAAHKAKILAEQRHRR